MVDNYQSNCDYSESVDQIKEFVFHFNYYYLGVSRFMTDLYYTAIIVFSLVFFLVVGYKTVKSVRTYMKKEKELNTMDERFDSFKSHRQNLLVSEFLTKAPLLLVQLLLDLSNVFKAIPPLRRGAPGSNNR